jgi:hypothetical protein
MSSKWMQVSQEGECVIAIKKLKTADAKMLSINDEFDWWKNFHW